MFPFSIDTNTKPSVRLRILLLLGLTVSNFLVVGLSAYSLYASRQLYDSRAEARSQNVATALSQSITSGIEKIDYALKFAVNELEPKMANLDQHRATLNGYLAAQVSRLPEIEGMRVIDKNGQIQLGLGPERTDSKPIFLTDRAYFLHHQEHVDGKLHISGPLWGRISKQHLIVFSRRLQYPDGTFAGVVYATVAIENFTKIIQRIDVGPNGIIVLRDEKFGLVARVPAMAGLPADQVGSRVMESEVETMLNSGQSNFTIRTSGSSGSTELTITARQLEKFPMMMVVGVASIDYLKPWLEEVYKFIAMVAVFALTSLVATVAFLRVNSRAEKLDEQVRSLAFYDDLTSLPSPRLGEDRLEMTLNQARRQGLAVGIMVLNMDRFKDVNLLYGQDTGDQALKTIALRISQGVRAVDTVARVGGDEFLVILGPLPGQDVAEGIAQRVIEALREPIPHGAASFSVSCSMGVSLFPANGTDANGLRRCANVAMAHVKRGNKNGFAFYGNHLAG